MSTEITLPKLSDTMDEGKILRWLKRVGDQVEPGDVIVEVETDKADMEVEAADGGVISEIRVNAGETAAVGAVLAVLDGDAKAAGKKSKSSEAGAVDDDDERPESGADVAAESGVGAGAEGGARRSAAHGDAEHRPAKGAAKGEEGEEESADEQETGDPEDSPADESDADDEPSRAEQRPAAKLRSVDKPAERETTPSRPSLKIQPSDAPQASGRKLRASPLAQRLARERGVDLADVRGSGTEGKIVARDVDAPAATPTAKESPGRAPAAPAKPQPTPAKRETLAPGRLELSKMRQSIARRMTEAKNGTPHFYVVAEIAMDEALRLLEALKQQVDAKITVSHLVAKATAMALIEHPRVNGQWLDGAVEIPESINIGLAVAVDDGLVVPVIHGCESLGIAELATEARRLVAAAREGRFSGDDLKGGTFSISNLGILDVDEFSAIINPPQAAILAVASIKERPVVREHQLAVGRTMRVTLSCDHRQLNGVEGARFLETLRAILESPLRMVV